MPLLFAGWSRPVAVCLCRRPCPASAAQAPPPVAGRILRPAFGGRAGARSSLLLYHSRHRKGKTKASRAAGLAFSLRLWFQANTPREKFPLDIRIAPWYIVGVWSHRTHDNGTSSLLWECSPFMAAVRRCDRRAVFLFAHIPRIGRRHFRGGGEYRPGCSDRAPAPDLPGDQAGCLTVPTC